MGMPQKIHTHLIQIILPIIGLKRIICAQFKIISIYEKSLFNLFEIMRMNLNYFNLEI